ncbi:MAG: response regulator transcription factor [Proteobacteria bacterium]|nr:response regulator transcription factor [Pseudomonadota bacterium]HQR03413.1 response regulator transcription factor [Rhodocyclaceae bacterium]
MQSSIIRVFLIDDHRSILWGLQRLIESGRPAIEFAGSAESCAEAHKVMDQASPDVILLDIDLGNENGVNEIPALLERSRAKILMLTGVRDKTAHDKAILAGASGVVEKEASAEIILTAIAKVHEGQVWLDREATGRVFVELAREGRPSGVDKEQMKISSLTQRERAIVAMTASNAGATAKTIAQALFISEHTLRNHFTSIYNKLDVVNRLELFAYAHKHGLTKADSISH